ncbi:MAG TPA: T9SS type A sorting domain-containing protein [Candidatus Kapabacteria bacterium]
MKRVVSAFLVIIAILSTTNALAQNPDDKNWSDKFGYPGIVSDGGPSVAVFKDTIYIEVGGNQYSQYRSLIYTSDGRTIKPFEHSPVLNKEGGIRDIAIDSSGKIFITGLFDSVNGIAARNIAMWNGNNWVPMGTGLYGGQNAMGYKIELFKGDIHVAGQFLYAGDELVNSIARWDGNTWHGLDSGFKDAPQQKEPGYIANLCTLNDSLLLIYGEYLIGKHVTSGSPSHILSWDGLQWSRIPASFTITNSSTHSTYYSFTDLVSFKGCIYVSGTFDSVDGKFARKIAKWDGKEWSGLPPDGNNTSVGALFPCYEGLYKLWSPNGAHWTGSSWKYSLPSYNFEAGIYYSIGTRTYYSRHMSIPRDSTLLYLSLAEIRDKQLYPIIDSTQGGVTGEIKDLATVGKDVYILGDFDGAGTKKNFKKPMHWDGISWNALPATDPPMKCNGIYSAGKLLYVCGDFKSTDGDSCTAIATWDGSRWGYMYPSTGGKPVFNNSSSARDFVVNEHDKIAFIEAERYYPEEMKNLYVVDEHGIDWVASYVSCYAFKDDTLFVLSVIDSTATFSRWDRVNGRIDIDTMILLSVYSDRIVVGSPCSMVIHGDDIYIAGDFTHIDDKLVNNIAVCNSNSWHALGGGIADVGSRNGYYSRTIEQIIFHGTTLYAAGYFIKAGDTTALNIAKWDGIEWSPVGSGVFERKYGNQIMSLGVIHCLSISDNKLHIAGAFTQAGGKNAQNISYYNLPPTNAVKDHKPTTLLTLSLYPNPTNHSITVTNETPIVSLTISDELGRTVIEISDILIEEVKVDCSQLSAGAYTVQAVLIDGDVLSGKFLTY